MQKIGNFIGMDLPEDTVRPSPKFNVILPKSTDAVDYSELYGPDELAYLNLIVAKTKQRVREQWTLDRYPIGHVS